MTVLDTQGNIEVSCYSAVFSGIGITVLLNLEQIIVMVNRSPEEVAKILSMFMV
jgi:hypothetical protein